ncbi:Mur ligase family protein [Algisphaera agarilytica]|uniref:UDP-N-acetylmuramoylalanine--D-glutamate ligase n=1 Tax=Algisphaera agarilytica TaxID=1385975 RepID=A0A7X0LJW1_9BACT|nr:UDP-N-acetylmuramoyl-L-alanine--D-glutamate ligase [Algisphaera agarilytica]MBB6429272.1 UDP-N-acetylmuramoylalanine--D-glutamate ligase [Algisphaera agarilytica]
MITEYQGKQITVMGLGRFGGGVGVTRFLAERGADVLITDMLPADELKDSVAQLADLEASGAVRYRLGEHDESDFTACDLLVVNPAVKPDNRFVSAARAAGAPITSEIRLLVKHLPNRLRTIGVTGSAGKSTTTAMTAHILRKVLGQDGETPCGDWGDLTPKRQDAKTPSRSLESPGVWMGGNIGGSLLPFVESIRDDDWVVLELSSFMLEGLREDEWSPHVAVITNISPNHLDWHGSMESYVSAKQAIFQYQETGDCLVAGDSLEDRPGNTVTVVEDTLPPNTRLLLPGRHNVRNGWQAAYAVREAKVVSTAKTALLDLGDFPGLPHRLEYVAESKGVRFYNDSKSTTPEASMLAIDSFETGTVHIILGGYDKGSDLSQLAQHASTQCACIYTIGDTGDVIFHGAIEAASWDGQKHKLPIATTNSSVFEAEHVSIARSCRSIESAVREAVSRAVQGQVVVLSPGCASWDQFANYEERGERFIELVKQYGAG